MKLQLILREMIFGDPTPTPECHASTLLHLPDGRCTAAWFAGTKEKANDVMIWGSIRENGSWSRPSCLTAEQGIPHWNPVLFAPDADTVQMFYKIGYTIDRWKTMTMLSRDGGRSWSDAVELIPGDDSGGRGPVKNKALRTESGRILAPASVERGGWQAFIDISDDGKRWRKAGIPADPGVKLIQPTLWECPAGQIHALLRSAQGRIYRSDSTDNGETWSRACPTAMPSNNSGIDCVRMDSGAIVLVCNPVEDNWGKRTPLTVFTSEDNGETFQKQLDLETEDGEFSYPAVIAAGDRVFVTYTWKRKKIAYCELQVIAQ